MRKKNLVTVLKKLVASFGGEGKGNNAVDLVDELADVTAEDASTPKLPVATAEDAGKVPTVQDDGSYALGQAGGGVNPVMVTITMTGESGGTWNGATWDELLSAFTNNAALAYLSHDGADQYYWLNYKMSANNETIVGLILDGSKINLSQDGAVAIQ